MKRLLIILTFLLLPTLPLIAQTSVCKVGSIAFKCPSKYYREVKVEHPTLRLFEYKDSKGKLYFYMVDPSHKFDPTTVIKSIPGLNESFQWKTETDPLVMDLGTKYKFDLVGLFGLSDRHFVEIKSFTFHVNNKRIILGYITDLSEDADLNLKLFRKGAGFSDNASGCNQVVTALNSVTHEFKDTEVGCELSAFGPAN